MSDQAVVMAVAAYASKAAAERDFRALATAAGGQDRLTAALVEKGADGRLTVDRYHGPAGRPACGLALLGGALVVLAAPLGTPVPGPRRGDQDGVGGRRRHRLPAVARTAEG